MKFQILSQISVAEHALRFFQVELKIQRRRKIDNWGGAHIHIFVFCIINPFEIDCFYGL